jgi:hypothetical protein
MRPTQGIVLPNGRHHFGGTCPVGIHPSYLDQTSGRFAQTRSILNDIGLVIRTGVDVTPIGAEIFGLGHGSVHEIAAFSGHKTLSEIAHYTRSVEQAALAREAMAKARTKLSKSVSPTVKNRKKARENKG